MLMTLDLLLFFCAVMAAGKSFGLLDLLVRFIDC
jgi:hypothetical protein